MISVPTIISDVVTRIRNNTDSLNTGTYTNDAPYFDFGHHAYISNVLKDKSKSSTYYNKVFPFIALILDIPENRGIDLVSYGEIDFNIVLATPYNKTSNIARETTAFKNILYPLCTDLLEHMWQSHLFTFGQGNSGKDIPHIKTDMYFYDSAEGHNKWNRYVDAIELRFRNVKLNIETNC